MGNAPYNRTGQKLNTDINQVSVIQNFVAHFQISAINAVVANIEGILAAVLDTGVQQVITEGLTNPSIPKNITATVGGTGANITANQVVIAGTNFDDLPITETLPIFTAATPGTVQGSKAFKTITSITIPANGVGVTTAIGFGEKIGLPYKFSFGVILATFLNYVKEVTAPTVTVDSVNIENNTIKLNSTLNGTVVDTFLIV